MTIFDGIILGILQGITEFLPVSSSGHLIIARDILGINTYGSLSFDAVLQLATACALLVYFRSDLFDLLRTFTDILSRKEVSKERRTLLFGVVFATIPAIVFGFLLEDLMGTLFRSASLVASALIFGSVLMFYAEKIVSKPSEVLTKRKAFVIGLFQSLALVPGISRSGSTISGGMILGLSREVATRFSFILAFPILFGSGLKKLFEIILSSGVDQDFNVLFFATVTAFLVGLVAIRFLLNFLKKRTLLPFIIYRLALALLIFVFV